jgi:hypothetical protein
MHTTIEYISAGVIMVLILGTTSQYTTNMVFDRINLIEQSAGVEKANKINDLLLLSPGKPVDWGDSIDEPEMIGLAIENSIKLYQLDSKKVKRLSEDFPNHISPSRVRDLLGLSAYYYTSINVYPLFNITVTQLSEEVFSVEVTNQWKRPISNVNITAAYLNVSIGEVTKSNITSFMDLGLDDAIYAFNMTNALGTCTLNFMGAGSQETLLIMASQLSAKCLTTWPTISEHIIGTIESSMGSVSGFNMETVYRNVEIDELNYIVRFTLWS